MLSDKASLDTRVGWIKQEIKQQLKQVEGYLRSYSKSIDLDEAEADLSLLEQSRDLLFDIMNTMQLTGVQGGERLALEMHALTEDLLAGKNNDQQTGLVVLQKGLTQIAEYLQHLEDGYADLPIVILPLLNELRASRGQDLLSEMLVFLPEDGAVGNSHIGTEEYISLSPENRKIVYRRLRNHFQQALVAWFSNNDADKALVKLQVLSNDLLRIHDTVSIRILWWLSKALIQALCEDKLEQGVAVKLIVANLERLILTFSQTDVDEIENLPEVDDLKKNLLYYIGMAKTGASHVDAVKEAFLLDVYLPQGDTLEKLRIHYASPGQKLWRSVGDGVNDDIESIMEGFQSMQLNPDAGIIQFIIDKSITTATTLSMLGLGRLASIIDQQVDEFQVFKMNPSLFSQARMVEIATEWLRVKDILQEYTETGEDATQRLFADNGQYNVSDYGARKKVLEIVESKLSSVIESLNGYEKEHNLERLEAAQQSMLAVSHTITFLGYQETYPLVDGCLFYLQKYTQEESTDPEDKHLSLLAESLASLESSIISLRNNADHLTGLESGYTSMLELHELCGLHENIKQQIVSVREGNQTSKKLNRQKKMELILTS